MAAKNVLNKNETTGLLVESLAILANGIGLDPADRKIVDDNLKTLRASYETVAEAAEELAEAGK